eukprot:TRINITY_DN60613_c0_g1_i1.p1 TRINITY_DN60613_c0_g1~~TRINITY_DN60613_c0_g1_i1.p1  ORF type:complete len:211 (+),score=52.24 TRINITY_DN60613_c0_g1_i1:81-713(+)
MALQQALLEKALRQEIEEYKVDGQLCAMQAKLAKQQEVIRLIERFHKHLVEKRIRDVELKPGQRKVQLTWTTDRHVYKEFEGVIVDKQLTKKWYSRVHSIVMTSLTADQAAWQLPLVPAAGGDFQVPSSRRWNWSMTLNFESKDRQREVAKSLKRNHEASVDYAVAQCVARKFFVTRLKSLEVVERIQAYLPPYVDHVRHQIEDLRRQLW